MGGPVQGVRDPWNSAVSGFGEGVYAWMTLIYLYRTVLQVPDVGRPVQRPLEPSCVRLGGGG